MEPKRQRGVECDAMVWGLVFEMLLLLAWLEEAVGAAGAGTGRLVWDTMCFGVFTQCKEQC